ncbi:hypothetical protein BHYA_0064g00260 [Botrytis hyacinthi]|uniref:Uncharacterized protein n=1 Tax=Botrytis hyacinthi TaxID=278943 RepID=A0A4Z1GUW1_9HELO|nr:hypothetical protein BHYA_0064g00260 [Botrytis hyacinthi]
MPPTSAANRKRRRPSSTSFDGAPASKRANAQSQVDSDDSDNDTDTGFIQSIRSSSSWSADDEVLLQRTTNAEEMLGDPQHYTIQLIPHGGYVDISTNNENIPLLQHAIRLATWHRLGQQHRQDPGYYTNDSSKSRLLGELEGSLNSELFTEIRKMISERIPDGFSDHCSFIGNIKDCVGRFIKPKTIQLGVSNRDLEAIADAWNQYVEEQDDIKIDLLLSSTKEYRKAFESRNDIMSMDRDTILSMKKSAILESRASDSSSSHAEDDE